METIQVVFDKKLLQATDRAALQTKRNRSVLVRDALREHLRRLTIQSLEARDRAGYSDRPPARDESRRSLGFRSGATPDHPSKAKKAPARTSGSVAGALVRALLFKDYGSTNV